MSTLRVRFAAMLATAAVVPLLTYGVVSVYSLRESTRRTVTEGNLNVARQVGEQVRRYISTNLQILDALAADLDGTGLDAAQQDRILKNYVLRFPEFRELTAFDAAGRPVATSRIGAPAVSIPGDAAAEVYGVRMSPVYVDNDLLPTALVAAPIGRAGREAGWLVGEFSIEELWRLTGRIRVGASGYAMVVSPRGDLLAHGNPEERTKVARGESLASDPVVAALRSAEPGTPEVLERLGPGGEPMLAVGVRVPDLDWMVIVEQPTREAFAAARRHERDLIAAISLALLVMLLAGLVWGRSLIQPIGELIRGTEADRRRPPRRARPHPVEDGAGPARRRVQQDGGPTRRSPGGRAEAGAPRDVRTRGRRPRARSVAPVQEHPEQLPARPEDARRPGVSGALQTHDRPRVRADQARVRGPPQHRAADADGALPARPQQAGVRRGRVDARQRRRRGPDNRARTSRRARSTSKATCSPSAASAATWS